MIETDKYIAINFRELGDFSVESLKSCECNWDESENCDYCWYYDHLNWIKNTNRDSYLNSDTVVVFKADRPYDRAYSCTISDLLKNEEFIEDLEWFFRD